MITLSAPATAPTHYIFLDNPEIGDNKQLVLGTSYYKAMDGSRYSHKKTAVKNTHVLRFTNLTRHKALELKEFFAFACGTTVRYIDKDSVLWSGQFTNETLDLTTNGLDDVDTTLVFEGNRV